VQEPGDFANHRLPIRMRGVRLLDHHPSRVVHCRDRAHHPSDRVSCQR
jgi:hypothetical protein